MAAELSPISVTHQILDADGPHNPHVKVAGDLDGDGADEVIVASSAGGPLVWYDPPGWDRHVIAPAGTWSCDARLVDLDGDGTLDLLVSEWYTHDRLEWYANPGDGRGNWLPQVIGHPKAHDIAVADLDGDGVAEIATRQQGPAGDRIVIWKRGDAGWRSRTLPCPAGEGLGAADLCGDGQAEIVIGGRWYRAAVDLMAGDFAEHVFAQWWPDAVARVADVTGDGRPAIVLTRSEGPGRLSWFEAPADPTAEAWTEHVVEPSLDFAHSLVIADVNGDGRPDIVTAEMHQSERRRVLVYLNEGGGASWRREVLADTGSHNLCVARLGAGRMAIVGANWSGPHQPIEAWIIEAKTR